MGGGDADPVTRLVGTLTGLGAELEAIKHSIGSIAAASPRSAELTSEVRGLRGTLLEAAGKAAAAAAAKTAERPAETSWESWLGPRLDALAAWLAESHRGRASEIEGWLGPRLDALSASMHAAATAAHGARGGDKVIDTQALLAQFRRIEDTLRPVVGAAAEQRAGDTLLANQMVQIIELLEQLGARLGNGRPRE